MGYTNDFFNGFIKWGVLLPDLRFFGDAGMEKSTGRDVDLYFLGGIQGFTWQPANYTGLINDLTVPGFVYFQRRGDDDNIPYKGSASSWIWCITLGRGDLTQIAWSNSGVVREIYFRRGGKTSSVGWSNGESWRKINLEALT